MDPKCKARGTKELNKWKVGRQVRAAGWRSLTRRRFIGRGQEISFYVPAAGEMRPVIYSREIGRKEPAVSQLPRQRQIQYGRLGGYLNCDDDYHHL